MSDTAQVGIRGLVLIGVSVAACGGGSAAPDASHQGPLDAKPDDAASLDATTPDAAPIDAIPIDAIPIDAIPPDARPPCDLVTMSPTSASYSSAAQVGKTITLTALPSGCDWSAVATDAWITVVNPGSGDGVLVYDVAANTGQSTTRNGGIAVTGNLFTISQAGAPCSFVATPSSQDVPATGGAYSATIDATPDDCAWTPSPDSTWITAADPSPRVGDGSFDYSVDVLAHGLPPRAGGIAMEANGMTVLSVQQTQP